VPVWHARTREWVESGRLIVVGIDQEQHAERCRLFAQWHGIGWPILHDPIDAMDAAAVPIFTAIDEYGIVRNTRPSLETLEADFLDADFPPPPGATARDLEAVFPGPPDLAALRRDAEREGGAAWRALGDALVLWRGVEATPAALDAYERALAADPADARSLFRAGVALRRRFDSPAARPGDFQAAVDRWSRALAMDPNQYVWRRRIQQYGPTLDKPYSFYDWVAEARAAIRARGETPVELAVEPRGSELAGQAQEMPGAGADGVGGTSSAPDPDGRVQRDDGLVRVDVAVVPSRLEPGGRARVHFSLAPDEARGAWWSNEGEPLRVWIELPEGWRASARLLEAPRGAAAETRETRRLDAEIEPPVGFTGTGRIEAWAVFDVCEDVGGQCLHRRVDLPFEVVVGGG